MKKIISIVIIITVIGLALIFRDQLTYHYLDTFVYVNRVTTLSSEDKNPYYLNKDYLEFKNINKFEPKNKADLTNIYFTVLNYGIEKFTFFCPKFYNDCLNDIKDLSDNQILLSHINNFVHPYNSFKNIETEYDSLGKITIKVNKVYDKNLIKEINEKVLSIEQEMIKSDYSLEEKIKIIHDYIINNSKYDNLRSDNKVNEYLSDIAYGNLIQGYGICGGYADSMKIFLDKWNVPNYKISSENHVWNLVKIDDKWLHLDLTWDDPVMSNGKDVLEYNFFLINTDELEDIKTNQHYFDKSIYKEAK